jgi:hypothetical protein
MILTKHVHIQCEDLMMLRFSNTKSSMLFKILSVDEAPRVELDKLLDKTTVQGLLCASRGSADIHWSIVVLKPFLTIRVASSE